MFEASSLSSCDTEENYLINPNTISLFPNSSYHSRGHQSVIIIKLVTRHCNKQKTLSFKKLA